MRLLRAQISRYSSILSGIVWQFKAFWFTVRLRGKTVRPWVGIPNRESHDQTVRVGRSVLNQQNYGSTLQSTQISFCLFSFHNSLSYHFCRIKFHPVKNRDLGNLLAVQKLSHHLSTKHGKKTTLTRFYVDNLKFCTTYAPYIIHYYAN